MSLLAQAELDQAATILFSAVVGDVLDQMGLVRQFLPPAIKAITPGMRVFGRAMPVSIREARPGDRPFGLLTDALDQLQSGEVYIAQSSRNDCAAWGELLTASAKARGARGAVVASFHRDTPQVLKQDWPVFSWGPYAQDAGGRSSVERYRSTIEVEGVTINPGDLVFGDIDGVVIIPTDIEREVIERAIAKALVEGVVLGELQRGESVTGTFARHGVL